MALTKKIIDSEIYRGDGSSFYAIWDDAIKGFGVRIYPSQKKSYILKYRFSGRQRIFVVGDVNLFNLVQARQKAMKFLSEIAEGFDPLESRQTKRSELTISEFCSIYLERHAKPHKKSWRDDESKIRRHIEPLWGKRMLSSIKREDIVGLHNKLGGKDPRNRNVPARTYEANRTIALLGKMFNLAKDWGFLEENAINPATKIKKFPEIKRDRWLKGDELNRLIASIDKEANVYVRAALWLYLLTGVRKNELLRIKRQDIDFKQKELILPETKSGRKHILPLTPFALSLFEQLPICEGNPYVFVGHKKGRHLVNIDKPWRRIRAEAGLEDARLHDLRRTLGSRLAMDGNSLLLIGKVLNHSNYSTTQIYARLSEEPMRKALEENEQKLLEEAGRLEGIIKLDGDKNGFKRKRKW